MPIYSVSQCNENDDFATEKEREQPVKSQEIVSPCTGVCRLNAADYCVGCWRHKNEIAVWSALTPAERDEIMLKLNDRK